MLEFLGRSARFAAPRRRLPPLTAPFHPSPQSRGGPGGDRGFASGGPARTASRCAGEGGWLGVGGARSNGRMDIAFIAGFGPIGTADPALADFWGGALGIPFNEDAPRYFHTEEVEGVKAFAIWPLDQAAEATFGTSEWPADRPVPQAWIEFDVASPGGGRARRRGAPREAATRSSSRRTRSRGARPPRAS